MTSWEVRAATVLAWLGVLPGVGCLALAAGAFGMDPGFLFAIIPLVIGFLLSAGVFLLSAAVALAVRLQRCQPGARLQTALLGGLLAGLGLGGLLVSPLAGVPLLLYGGAMLWLMMTPGAARDLGGWTSGMRQPAPWGSRPGTKLWSDEAPVQGPWSPDPRTLPNFSWKGFSGPRVPWWQTWQAGLAQGIPLWELLIVGGSLLVFLAALLTSWLPGLHLVGFALLPVSFAGVWFVEQRMRARLARGRQPLS